MGSGQPAPVRAKITASERAAAGSSCAGGDLRGEAVNRPANFGKLFLRPFVVVVAVVAVAVGWVVGYGEALLASVDHSVSKDSLARPEIWVAVIPCALIVVLATVIAYSPKGRFGFLERETLIGRQPIFAPPPPAASELSRSGAQGRLSDVTEGWVVWGNDQALGRVVGIVPSRRGETGYLYVNGFEGNARQIWVPTDAVHEIYPATRSAFLRMRGHHPAAYGWTSMPESVKPVRGN
jgi:hypothetical protein